MSESWVVDSSLFYFHFYFHFNLFQFIFYFEVGLEFRVILHVTITNGYITRPSVTHQSHNTMEGSRRF